MQTKLKITPKLLVLLMTTKKQFLLYNTDIESKKIVNYRLTDDYELTGNNRNFSNYKVITCIKNELTNITF